MQRTPGSKLGPYEIVSALGAGGMGEVYRARDTKLNRDVALKILPDAFTTDADRLGRFKREAQVLASLNHPNIAAIYGFEDSGPTHALVMELVEGEDLSRIIARGPIALAEALPIASQVAYALEAAHEQGIVHRDLKPANVKVREDGTVKVLDFGLAKAMDPAGASAATDAANSPTLTARATAMGVIMGTAAYMSPEQAAGKSVDKRSDLWSFGVVLLEMLTGRRTFDGETLSHVLASVLKDAPDFSALPADTPASIRKLLRRCLEKDRKKRLDSAAAARLEIDDAMAGASDVATVSPAAPVAPPASSGGLPWAVAGVLAAALGVVLWPWAPWNTSRATSAAAAAALSLTPLSFEQGGQTAAVWSPDGKAVAFAARQQNTEPYQVFVRYLASAAPTQITKLAGGVDGIIEWTASGKIVFYGKGLWSVSPVGGEPEPLGRSVGTASKLQVVAVPSITRDGSTLAGVFRAEDGVDVR